MERTITDITKRDIPYTVNFDSHEMYNKRAAPSLSITSTIEIYAKADIFSCAIIKELYGIASILKIELRVHNWYTTNAATLLPSGMFSL